MQHTNHPVRMYAALAVHCCAQGWSCLTRDGWYIQEERQDIAPTARGEGGSNKRPSLSPAPRAILPYSPVRDEEALLMWMRLLCTELAHRIGVDRKAWSRRATKLTLQVISLKSGSRCARPPRQAGPNRAELRPATCDLLPQHR